MKNITIYLLIISNALVAQNCEINESSISWLKKDIEYLSDDKLEGRETGTQGEILALKYLENRFHEVGLSTKIHEFELKQVDKDKLYGFLRKMEFNRLLSSVISKYGEAKFESEKPKEKYKNDYSKISKKNYQLIKNENEIEKWL